jgi:hypothetical protein
VTPLTSLENAEIGDYVVNGIFNDTVYVFMIENDNQSSVNSCYPRNLATGFGGDYTNSGQIVDKYLA